MLALQNTSFLSDLFTWKLTPCLLWILHQVMPKDRACIPLVEEVLVQKEWWQHLSQDWKMSGVEVLFR